MDGKEKMIDIQWGRRTSPIMLYKLVNKAMESNPYYKSYFQGTNALFKIRQFLAALFRERFVVIPEADVWLRSIEDSGSFWPTNYKIEMEEFETFTRVTKRRWDERYIAPLNEIARATYSTFRYTYKRIWEEDTWLERRICLTQPGTVFRDIFPPPLVTPLETKSKTIDQIVTDVSNGYDFKSIPVLADALEDAGCDNQIVLQHCREHKYHSYGCWVLTALRDAI